ncbi:MAG: D-aminoacylase [Acidobacteriaceae bacterium]|nr:D-aminoacylase [Acidobacteriaceae bacterium]
MPDHLSISPLLLRIGACALAFVLHSPAQSNSQASEYDLIIRNGRIMDGTGNPWFRGDVAVTNDRIAAIGKLTNAHAKQTIDAAGKVVAPGFIDMLGQSEEALLIDNRSLSKLSQGITTEITGEGGSIAPQNQRTLLSLQPDLDLYHLKVDWTTLDGYFKRLEAAGTPLNIGTYVGAAQVREAIVGTENRAPSAAELDQMKALVEQAMQDGAFGLSTALIYPPGHYASTEELIDLAKVSSRYGGIYASHMRGEGTSELEAVDEAIRIGREANLPVEIFHLKVIGKSRWNSMPQVVEKIESARRSGVDIAADMYPYPAGGTALAASLPPWVASGGGAKLLERLQDAATRSKIRQEMASEHKEWENLYLECGPAGVRIATVNNPELRKYLGQSVADVAAAEHKDPLDALFDFVLRDKAQTGALYFFGSEVDSHTAFAQPWTSVGLDANEMSLDGPLFEAHTHPRAFGTMPRILGRYCREDKLLPMEACIRKITSLPADREQLSNRGLLKTGFYADITVFDPDTIIDQATFEHPTELSKGIEYVFVNGRMEYDHGRLTGEKAGRPLRGRGWTERSTH